MDKMTNQPLGKPRSLSKVVLYSSLSLLAYYGYYKWVIQDELRRYDGQSWSGALCLIPFFVGVLLPQILWRLDPDVEPWFGWFSIIGLGWIYYAQFRLYCTVNQMYRQEGWDEPLAIWWMLIPGLNILVGFRQIHFLSAYWAKKQNQPTSDRFVKMIPFLFADV
jgi:hypothetical protein